MTRSRGDQDSDRRVETQPPAAYRRLFEPIRIGNVDVRNRILNPTHHVGGPEDRQLRYLVERARGGAGLIGLFGAEGAANYTVGFGPVSRTPAWDERPLPPLSDQGVAYYDDLIIPRLQRISAALHEEGAACFSQIYHMGAAPHHLSTQPPIGPSAVADPYDSFVPHAMSHAEIEDLVQAFALSVRRAQAGGVDGVEIHAAHGYLVAQFLSPYFNRRADSWGGSRENRVRFLLSILTAARELVGRDFPIGVRLGVDGDGHGRGIMIDEQAEIAHMVAPLADYISVSGGSHSGFGGRAGAELAYVSPWYREPAHNAEAAAAVKRAVDIPVFVTGRIADPSIAEGLLADGIADMVGMVRGLIADPQLPNKVRRGQEASVRMCLGLSECHHIGLHRSPGITCAVNAAAGREAEMAMRPAKNSKVVVVVGAGPAGMEAARVAASRGHVVYLADRQPRIGGTPRILAEDPNRRNLRDHSAFFDVALARLKVTLMLGNTVSADELVEFAPDAVVVATGGSPLIPEVPGATGPQVLTALAVLHGEVPRSERVLVVAGTEPDLGAGTVAEHLADQGCRVELISEHIDFAPGVEMATRITLLNRLLTRGVQVSTHHRLNAVVDAVAEVEDTFTGATRSISDVTVVLACGLLPDDGLARELTERGMTEIHLVGDALAPRRIMHATLEGARAAMKI